MITLNLGGDKFDEREDGSDVGGARSQLQALIQEVSSAGMSPQVQPAPDEHKVPGGRRRRQVRGDDSETGCKLF